MTTVASLIESHKDLTTGYLPSGIEFNILPCEIPKSHVELRLVVKVGSFMETDNQRGFAHFIEHLGFKGTKSFSKYDLVKRLEGLGITYGPDLNASTSFHETKYKLALKIDDGNVIDRLDLGLNILLEWATSMTISRDDVEEEKAVILAEFRGKQGLSRRLVDKYWYRIFGKDSLYSSRFPIGVPDTFMNASSEEILAFYKKWYRPERMTILIVGDIGDRISEIETLLRSKDVVFHPESLVLPAPSLSVQLFGTPMWHSHDEVVCLSDPELTTSSVMIEFFKSWPSSPTRNYVRQDVLHRLMTSIIDKRLHNLSKGYNVDREVQEDNTAFKSAGISIRQLVPGLCCIGLTASLSVRRRLRPRSDSSSSTTFDDSSDESTEAAVAAAGNPSDSVVFDEKSSLRYNLRTALFTLLLEMRRLRELGIRAEELDAAKERWRLVFQDRLRGHIPPNSAALTAELEAHVLADGQTVFADIQTEASVALSCLEEVSLGDMTSFLQLLDMHESEASCTHNYANAPTAGCFRVLTVQSPELVDLPTQPVGLGMCSQVAHVDGDTDINTTSETITDAGVVVPSNGIENSTTHVSSIQSAGWECDEASVRDLLQSVREDVRAHAPLHQWPQAAMISPEDVIAAAARALTTRSGGILLPNSPTAPSVATSTLKSGTGDGQRLGGNDHDGAAAAELKQAIRKSCRQLWNKGGGGGGACGDECSCSYANFLPPSLLASGEGGSTGSRVATKSSSSRRSNLGRASVPTSAYVDLMREIPVIASSAVNIHVLKTIDAVQVQLPNGMTVCLKWMAEDSPNKISMQAFALGGSSELSEAEDTAFTFLDDVAWNSGFDLSRRHEGSDAADGTAAVVDDDDDLLDTVFKGQDMIELQQRCKTRVNTQKHDYFRGLGGSCPRANLELLLSLIVLKCTSQSLQAEELNRILRRQAEGLEYRENSPEAVFMERARIVCCGDIPICRPLTREKLVGEQGVRLEAIEQLYTRAFVADPTEFTYVFVGDLPPQAEVLSLLSRYLGLLSPSASLMEQSGGPWVRKMGRAEEAAAAVFTPVATTPAPAPALVSSSTPTAPAVISYPASNSAMLTVLEAVGAHPSDSLQSIFHHSTATTASTTSHSSSQAQPDQAQLDPPFKPLGATFPKMRVRETIRRRISDKASTLLVFRADFPLSDLDDFATSLLLDVACRILQVRLLDELRIRLGKVYYVAAEKSRNSLSSFALISVVTDCDPADLEQVQDVIEAQILALQQTGLDMPSSLPSSSSSSSSSHMTENVDGAGVFGGVEGSCEDVGGSTDSLINELSVHGIREALLQQHAQALSNPSYWLFWILDAYKAFQVYSHGNPSFGISPPSLQPVTAASQDSEMLMTDMSRLAFRLGLQDDPVDGTVSQDMGAHGRCSRWVDVAAALRSVHKISILRSIIRPEAVKQIFCRHFNLSRSVLLSLAPLVGTSADEHKIPVRMQSGFDFGEAAATPHDSVLADQINRVKSASGGRGFDGEMSH